MSTKKISVLGFTNSQRQFVVKSSEVSVSNKENIHIAPSNNSFEQVLAELATSLNTTGRVVAKEQNFRLSAMQIEISASYDDTSLLKENNLKPDFKKIRVIIKPVAESSITELKIWMDTIKERYLPQENISKKTDVILTVIKEFDYPKAA